MLTLNHNFFRVIPNNKTKQDDPQHFNKRKFMFGILILLLVDVLWVVSSEVTKYIYVEKKLERPFLVTYIRSSMLFIYLIILCFTPPTRDPCRPADYTQLMEPTAETDDENYFTESTNSLGDSTFVPVRAGETTDSDDAAPRAVRFNKVAEVRVMSAAQAGEALLARLSWAASVRATEYAQRRAAAAATRRHLRLALLFCAPWFVSNYLFRLSLLHTSPGAATIYTSSTSAMAVTLGALFAQVPSDRFTLSKSIALVCTAVGLVILSISEPQQNTWVGTASGLASALCYSLHLLMFRREMRKGDGINSPLFVGLVGCACGGVAWALGGALGASGIEKAELPPSRMWTWLLIDAAVGPLLIESLWLWGRSLTSSLAATCTLGLTIPLAVCIDVWRGGGVWRAVAGAIATVGWTLAVAELPQRCPGTDWLGRIRTDGFSVVRNIPDLDEQSEALMSSDEPT